MIELLRNMVASCALNLSLYRIFTLQKIITKIISTKTRMVIVIFRQLFSNLLANKTDWRFSFFISNYKKSVVDFSATLFDFILFNLLCDNHLLDLLFIVIEHCVVVNTFRPIDIFQYYHIFTTSVNAFDSLQNLTKVIGDC